MPTIICSYCGYVGSASGKYRDDDEIIADVEAHEEYCEVRLANEEADKIDAAYEQARADGWIDFSQNPPRLKS